MDENSKDTISIGPTTNQVLCAQNTGGKLAEGDLAILTFVGWYSLVVTSDLSGCCAGWIGWEQWTMDFTGVFSVYHAFVREVSGIRMPVGGLFGFRGTAGLSLDELKQVLPEIIPGFSSLLGPKVAAIPPLA